MRGARLARPLFGIDNAHLEVFTVKESKKVFDNADAALFRKVPSLSADVQVTSLRLALKGRAKDREHQNVGV